jgi:hypothetical protein
LEAAFLSVPRENFYLIEEFNLNKKPIVSFGANGNFTISPTQWRTMQPEKEIADYLIRTAYSTAVLMKSERRKMFDVLEKQGKVPIVKDEVTKVTEEWKKESNNNIFHITTFQPTYLYGLYHPVTVEKLNEEKRDEWTGHAEVFQVVMVASKILEHLFHDDIIGRGKMKAKMDSYLDAFCSEDEALKKAHLLEAHAGALPTSNKIQKDQFRRAINNNYASIASFFALAVYDEVSFRFAHCLTMDPRTGIKIPQGQRLFGDDLLRMVKVDDEESVTWLE